MKKILALVAVFAFSVVAFAQEHNAEAPAAGHEEGKMETKTEKKTEKHTKKKKGAKTEKHEEHKTEEAAH